MVGFPGLKNDERTLLRAKMQTRVVLAEVRRVLVRGDAAAVLPPVLGIDAGARVPERIAAEAGNNSDGRDQ